MNNVSCSMCSPILVHSDNFAPCWWPVYHFTWSVLSMSHFIGGQCSVCPLALLVSVSLLYWWSVCSPTLGVNLYCVPLHRQCSVCFLIVVVSAWCAPLHWLSVHIVLLYISGQWAPLYWQSVLRVPPFIGGQCSVCTLTLAINTWYASLDWQSVHSLHTYIDSQCSVCPLTLAVSAQCASLHWRSGLSLPPTSMVRAPLQWWLVCHLVGSGPLYIVWQRSVRPHTLVVSAQSVLLHWWSDLSVPPCVGGHCSVCYLALVISAQCALPQWWPVCHFTFMVNTKCVSLD